MSGLREMMNQAVGASPSPEVALEHTMDRVRRRQRRRTVATGLTALLLSGAAIGLLWVGFFGDQAPVDTATTPSADPGSLVPIVAANVAVGDFPSALTIGEGSVWVAVESRSGGENLVARIDPATNEVTTVIPVDGLPGQVAIENGSLWIGLAGSVQRLDPETGEVVAEIVGPGTFLTRTPGAVWALDSANSIARIDPTTNQIVATVALDLPPDGYITSPPVGTLDAVWVIATRGGDAGQGANGQLFRIDTNTNSVVARINVDAATTLTVGDGAVWMATDYAANRTYLTRVDAATNQAAAPVIVEGGWTPFAVGAGRLWLMGGMEPEIRVAGLNLATLELEGPIVVGELPAFEGSGVFDAETDTVWISQYEGSVTRVDLRSTPTDPSPSTR